VKVIEMRIPRLAACVLLFGLRALPASAEGERAYPLVPASFDVLRDEREIWKDLFQIHREELRWILPLAVANAAAIATDGTAYRNINTSKSIQTASHAISSLGAPYPLFAASGSMYLFGRYTGSRRLRGNRHFRNTGSRAYRNYYGRAGITDEPASAECFRTLELLERW
jgi:hypothetical protein